MIYRVIVTARAIADTIEAFRFKDEQSTQAATRWLAGLEKSIAKLRLAMDSMGHKETKVGAHATRRFIEYFTETICNANTQRDYATKAVLSDCGVAD